MLPTDTRHEIGEIVEMPKTGARLACTSCGTAIIVVKAPTAWPTCCGAPLEPVSGR